LNRRNFIAASLAAAVTGAGLSTAHAQISTANVSIIVAGAGAAGLSLVSRLRRSLPNAKITLIDAKKEHHFQPGLTLVGAGLWAPGKIIENNATYVPKGVNWIQEAVAEFDPDSNTVVTQSGQSLKYDFLFVATGLALDYSAIDGMSTELIGENGIASIYAGPSYAQKSARAIDAFLATGGVGLFGRPATEMKCAGAPLKITCITDDKARINKQRGGMKLIYNAHNDTVFSVAPVDAKVRELFSDRDIAINESHNLTAINPDSKVATYQTPDGQVDLDYDFIHIVPPMRAPEAVRNSPLPWQSGPWANDGWIEVDKSSLRHLRFPNVFAVGDIAGVPRGKTAASVKWQVPIAIEHLIAELNGTTTTAAYNGYTSCPMVTRYGRAMLIEFDYDGTLIRSFPFIDPLQELWVSWMIDEKGLLGTYRAMLRGRA